MIRKLLEVEGQATDIDIANALLQYDPSQIEYYQSITNNMVGKVLRTHNIVERNKKQYKLVGFEELTPSQIEELKQICNSKVDAYIQKRGDAIWSHRTTNRVPVSGSIRYQVLKRASFRCELCGISAEEKALEVDHITPKNLGGEDSINNYQALCYSCNASKKDKDDTDFRGQHDKYNCRDTECLFCKIDKNRIIAESNLAYAIQDKYPVSTGHTLIIPKRHFPDYFEITQPELNAVNTLLSQLKQTLQSKDDSISAFNIGINSGPDAGQTIFHTHIHLIPRRKNDVDQPIGGIRNIMPGKGDYNVSK
ncbi:MAG: HIT domain-containing protein [Sediminibacterium sp.]